MSRSEEILFEINKLKYKTDCPFDYEDGFKRDVKWADKNPKEGIVSLVKVCEWLENNFVCFLQGAKRGIYSNQFVTVNEMVDNFKERMEE